MADEVAERSPADAEAARVAARRAAALAHVVQWGDPVLRTPAAAVERFDAELADRAAGMARLMDDALGAGLAANQVGWLRRLLVHRVEPGAPLGVLVNPEIDWASDETEAFPEGCLSLPGVWVEVERAERVRVRAQDLSGAAVIVEGAGREASVLQHEIDHLDGILVLDRIATDQRRAAVRRLREELAARSSLA